VVVRKVGVKEWEYKAEILAEEVGEKGEEKVVTSVAIATQAWTRVILVDVLQRVYFLCCFGSKLSRLPGKR